MQILEWLSTVFSDFADPKKRIFVGYLLLSFLIGLIWLVLARRISAGSAFRQVFDRKVFFSPSAIADYKIFVLNRMFSLFISPLLVTQLAIATAVYFSLHRVDFFQSGVFSDVGQGWIVGLFTLSIFLVDDLTKYLVHRWMHRIPALWAIHKVHHSATTMTPVTVYRVHPLEGILYGLRATFAQGTTMAAFFFFFGDAVDLYTVIGVNILSFVFHMTGSNLRHSHIDIRYWPWLEHLLISPAQHQVHHSIAREHHDKNFGVAFAVWDWLFGSLHLSERDRSLTFGLQPHEASASKITDIYLRPFSDIGRLISKRVSTFKSGGLKKDSAKTR